MDEQQALQLIEVRRVRKKRRKWLLISLAALPILVIVGIYPAWTYLAKREWESAVAEAERLDGPWRLDDLEAKREVIPDAENSYQIVSSALPLLPSAWPRWDYGLPSQNHRFDKLRMACIHDSQPNVQLEQSAANELRKEMNRAALALSEVRKFIDMPRGRTPITYSADGVSTLLTGTNNAREMASMLAYDLLLRLQDGDAEGALADCRGIINAAHCVGDEPTLISVLIRASMQWMAVGGIERCVAQSQLSEENLAKMQRILDEESKVPLLLIGARGERAMGDRMMQALYDGRLDLRTVWRGMAPIGFDSFWLRFPAVLDRNRAALLRLENQLVEAAKLPVEEQAQKIKELKRNPVDLSVLAQLMLSAELKPAENMFRIQAELRCAILLLAAERYRKAHGRWPGSLDELVPQYLARVPTDPFDGKPIRLKPIADGLIIYSIGLDEEDNNGTLGKGNKYTKQGTDLGSQLWNVNQRRLPYRPPKDEE
jgi:hypothetical protein